MECTCNDCRGACLNNPGFMTPDQAKAAIAAGVGGKLMLDWWEPDEHTNYKKVYLLVPASLGCEGDLAPEFSFIQALMGAQKGRCTFLNSEKLCDIHASGFKPSECVFYDHTKKHGAGDELRVSIVKAWMTDESKAIVKAWAAAHEIPEILCS